MYADDDDDDVIYTFIVKFQFGSPIVSFFRLVCVARSHTTTENHRNFPRYRYSPHRNFRNVLHDEKICARLGGFFSSLFLSHQILSLFLFSSTRRHRYEWWWRLLIAFRIFKWHLMLNFLLGAVCVHLFVVFFTLRLPLSQSLPSSSSSMLNCYCCIVNVIQAHIYFAHANTHDFTHWLTAENLNGTRQLICKQNKFGTHTVYIIVKPSKTIVLYTMYWVYVCMRLFMFCYLSHSTSSSSLVVVIVAVLLLLLLLSPLSLLSIHWWWLFNISTFLFFYSIFSLKTIINYRVFSKSFKMNMKMTTNIRSVIVPHVLYAL